MRLNGRLGNRVDALEAIAEEVRYRPHRLLAAAHGIDPEGVIANAKRYEEMRDRMLADGKGEREIVEAMAARLGLDPDDLLRRTDELVEWTSGRGPLPRWDTA